MRPTSPRRQKACAFLASSVVTSGTTQLCLARGVSFRTSWLQHVLVAFLPWCLERVSDCACHAEDVHHGLDDFGLHIVHICSHHFLLEDYEANPEVRRSLGMDTKRIRLNPNAVPIQNLLFNVPSRVRRPLDVLDSPGVIERLPARLTRATQKHGDVMTLSFNTVDLRRQTAAKRGKGAAFAANLSTAMSHSFSRPSKDRLVCNGTVQHGQGGPFYDTC
ncbi:hypothetical protein ISCGN_015739 [Ixodes scapularis]